MYIIETKPPAATVQTEEEIPAVTEASVGALSDDVSAYLLDGFA
jgi:hypothetical protein